MSKPIASPILPEQLARKDRSYSVSVPLGQFKRLAELLQDTQGDFTAECTFKAWDSHTQVTGQWQADLSLMCQRCLGPLSFKVDVPFELICVVSAQVADELDNEFDPVILDEERQIELVDLFEDEIILQLPTVARHEGDEPCSVGKMEFGKLPDNIESGKRKPFEALKDLKF